MSLGVPALSAVLLLSAAFMALMGVAVFARGPAIIEQFGHKLAALPQAFAGRYIAMGGILAGLTVAGEWRAIAITLSVGAAMGLLDAWVVRRAGGPILPHLIAAAVCLALAWAAAAMR